MFLSMFDEIWTEFILKIVTTIDLRQFYLHVLFTRALNLMSMTLESRDLIGGNGLRNAGGHVTVQHASLVSA